MGRKEGTGERPLSLLLRVLALFFFSSFSGVFIFLYRRFRRSPRLVVCVAGLVCGEGSVLLSVKYCMDDCNVLSTALFGDESGVLVDGCWQQWHGKHSLFVTCDELFM